MEIQTYRGCGGFTLIELMISLAIIAILTGVGIPSFTSFKTKAERDALISTFHRTLAMARFFALNQVETTTLCGINTQGECVRSNFNTIAVFLDNNTNGEIDDDERIITTTPLDYKGELTWRASLNRKYVRFKKRGNAAQAGSFVYCNKEHPTVSARVTVSLPGRAYTARERDQNGIITLVSGEAIGC